MRKPSTQRGADLLALISDILDLAKIESGTVTLNFGPLRLTDLRDYVDRTFRPTALEQNLDFTISIDPRLPTVIETDEKRLQQILKNLLSNAFQVHRQGLCRAANRARGDRLVSGGARSWTRPHR